ncbi:MAG: DNA repair protein RecO [Ignavibacteria bacterium]|nr:DNA repair protein RecO [Ignavibacteria bacterium]
MSEIIKDKGVVLKKRNFRETSKLVSIFSENNGKINLIAKGVRTLKSKLSAVLEPMNFIEFVYYKKAARDLQFLSAADFLDDFTHIKSDFNKIQSAFAMLELTNIFVHENESNPVLFQKLVESLTTLNNGSIKPKLMLIYYIVHLLDSGGYPVLHSFCPACNKTLFDQNLENYFSRHFGIVCTKCGKSNQEYYKLTKLQFETITNSSLGRISELDKNMFDDVILNETLGLLENYIAQHVSEFKGFKSFV